MPSPMRDSRCPPADGASEDARWTIGRSGLQSSSNPDILYEIFLAPGQTHTPPPPSSLSFGLSRWTNSRTLTLPVLTLSLDSTRQINYSAALLGIGIKLSAVPNSRAFQLEYRLLPNVSLFIDNHCVMKSDTPEPTILFSLWWES